LMHSTGNRYRKIVLKAWFFDRCDEPHCRCQALEPVCHAGYMKGNVME
jgi:hypothetical protein